MDSVPSVPLGSHLEPSLPPSFPYSRRRVRGLSFTSVHFSLPASQAGSRSTDQGWGCLGRIINYWPQAHTVPDRPRGGALYTEIPAVKKGVEEELPFHSPSPESWSQLNSCIQRTARQKKHPFLSWRFLCMF